MISDSERHAHIQDNQNTKNFLNSQNKQGPHCDYQNSKGVS